VSVLIDGVSAGEVFERQMTKLAKGICVSCMEEHYASLSKRHNTRSCMSSLPTLPMDAYV
jgi:hypothetical protein